MKNASSYFGEHYGGNYQGFKTAFSHFEYSQYVGVLCCCGYSAACASRVSNLNLPGSTLRILPMLAVYFAFARMLLCIADRYQVPSKRYQVFDTAHARSISAYILRLLPVVILEYFILVAQIMRVYSR